MIVLARHGQTEANRDGLLVGRIDPVLTPLGIEQADRLGIALADSSAVRVVSSPLTRTRQTADAIAARLGLEVEIDDRLVEMDYGAWDGTPLADIPIETWRAWRTDAEFRPPDGESLRDVARRVGAAMGEWLTADDPVIAVTHVSPIKAALTWALGAPETMAWRMFVEVASISRIGLRQGAPCMLGFNDTTHLG
ncbi:MAG: histidine phosphatase family protein [Actinomycetes bacterium]